MPPTSRKLRKLVLDRLKAYPAVVLLGARQCGKTTLAKTLPKSIYLDLEQDADRLRLDLEWESLTQGNHLLILDEAQTHPVTFAKLRGAIDSSPKRRGRFLILGSVAPNLMRQVSESLAGRTGFLELSPFLPGDPASLLLAPLWLYGGYPLGGILKSKSYPQWQHDYLDALLHRDLQNLGIDASPVHMKNLCKMLAVSHGQTLNTSELGRSLGVSYHTVQRYLEFLEGMFLIRRLEPYHANLGKRLTKAPKIYWRDSGILHALLNIRTRQDLLAHPRVGASWEGFVLESILNHLHVQGRLFEAYFFRTSDGYELDLLLRLDQEWHAIETKLTAQPTQAHAAKLMKAADFIGPGRRWLVTQVEKSILGKPLSIVNLQEIMKQL
jgi:uncharacterized protein